MADTDSSTMAVAPRRGRPRKIVDAVVAANAAEVERVVAVAAGAESLAANVAPLSDAIEPETAGAPALPAPLEPMLAATPPAEPDFVPAEDAASSPTKGFFMATTFAPSNFAVSPEGIQSMFADLQTRAKASVEKSAKLAEEVGEFAKGNVEAVMTSSRIAAKGAETIGQEVVEYGKKSFEGAAAAFKTMAAAKSPTELFKLQSDYARASFDAAVTEGSKMSEAWLKLFGDIAQPLSNRMALAADKIKAPAA